MTTITSTLTIDYTDGAPLAADDPRVPFARALQVARAVVGRVDPTTATSPSPCDEWDAFALARHIVAVLDRVTGAAEGRDLDEMPILSETPVGDLTADFDAAAERLHEAWADRAVLGRELTLPFGVLPGAATIGVYTSELLVHSWDLAAAIGASPNWPDADIEVAIPMLQAALPAKPRGGDFPFSAVVPTPEHASAVERLVAWMGRDPGAWR